MTTPLEITLEVLNTSRNESALTVLLAGLDSSDGAVYEAALRGLIARRSKKGHLAVLKRWHQLNEHQRDFLLEGRGRISGALRDAVLADEDQLFRNACELVEAFDEFDLVPTLVTLAENQKSAHAQAATELVGRLVDRLSELFHGPRDYKDRRDPESLRRNVLESLERSVERFRQHQRPELIEAFVVLGGASSGLLREILDDPRHACYLTVITTLTTSESTGILEFLLSSLQCDFASLNLLNVISKRTDKNFVSRLLEYVSNGLSPNDKKNLGRIRAFAWLQPGEEHYSNFDDEDQSQFITLVAASGVKQEELLKLLESVLHDGGSVGRLAACEALASIQGDRASQLVLDSTSDDDPQVQAAAARQLRDRHIPGTMAVLLRLIDSPYEVVREATCQALSEFSFENFLIGFDTLGDDARRSTGALVQKVDPDTIPSLQEELEATSRSRRLRAIEMAEFMELVPHVGEQLMELLTDEDHMIRAAAADALQFCPTAEVAEALQLAADDKSGAVKNAAANSLEVFAELGSAGPIPSMRGAS